MNWTYLINQSLAQMLDFAAPILFAALGGVISENAGVVNIALDGIMRFAAFFGVWGAFRAGDPLTGLLWGVGIGFLLGVFHAYITVKWAGDQIVSGVAINIVAVGVITYFLEWIFETTGYSPPAPYFGDPKNLVNINFIENVPRFGYADSIFVIDVGKEFEIFNVGFYQ